MMAYQNRKKLLGFLLAICFALILNKVVAQSGPDPSLGKLINNLLQSTSDTGKVNALLSLSKFYVSKPGEDTADIKLSLQYAGQGHELSKRVNYTSGKIRAYTLIAQNYREKGDALTGLKWASKALKEADMAKNPDDIMNANFEMSNFYNIETDSGSKAKIKYYSKAVSYLKRLKPGSLELADGLKFLADLNSTQDNYEGALKDLKQSMVLYKVNHYDRIQDVYSLMTAIFVKKFNFKEALKYALLGVNTIQKFKDSSSTACTAYNRLGVVYIGLKDFNHAIAALEAGYQLALKTKEFNGLYYITGNLAAVYTNKGLPIKAVKLLKKALQICPPDLAAARHGLSAQIIDAYIATQKLEEAKPYYQYIYTTCTDTSKEGDLAQICRVSALKLLIATKNLGQFSPIMVTLERTAAKKRALNELTAAAMLNYQADSLQENYLSALKHHELYKRYNDSLLNRSLDKQIMTMQAQFETAQKDLKLTERAKVIKVLEQKNLLQDLSLNSQRLARNVSVGAAGLLALLLAVGYNRYQLKQRNNQELQAKQTEINKQNEHLKALLTEREWLLKEIHHRIKNNLQIIISLLNSQSKYLRDQDTLDVLQESQNRIFSISLIHQKLYQDNNVSGISLQTYIKELTSHLANTFGTTGRVRFKIDVDDILLDVSQAVPLGLIMNEAITNAMKYAFPNQSHGLISLMLVKELDDWLNLEIADNGIGLPAGFETSDSETLGMTLIKGLSEQMSAFCDINGQSGVKITLRWRKVALQKSLPINI